MAVAYKDCGFIHDIAFDQLPLLNLLLDIMMLNVLKSRTSDWKIRGIRARVHETSYRFLFFWLLSAKIGHENSESGSFQYLQSLIRVGYKIPYTCENQRVWILNSYNYELFMK